jgi:hypothetical protein
MRTGGGLFRRVLHHDALVVPLVAGTVLPGKVAADTTAHISKQRALTRHGCTISKPGANDDVMEGMLV